MNKEQFEKTFRKYSECFWNDLKNKSVGKAIDFPKSSEIANGLRVLTKLAFKTINDDFYFNVGQIQVTVNKNILFFIKEEDVEILVNNHWQYNPSYNFIYYEEGNHRKGYF